jgi:ArsR family transcriptional regulator, arsenate/arsenite/antimonite-responsive transcriptional repressor
VILPSFTSRSMLSPATMQDVGTVQTATPAISPLAGEPINRVEAERLAGVLKAFADPARLRLLSLIQSARNLSRSMRQELVTLFVWRLVVG